jgi:hypothetical protein
MVPLSETDRQLHTVTRILLLKVIFTNKFPGVEEFMYIFTHKWIW